MMLPWEPKAGRYLEDAESYGLPVRLVLKEPRLLFFGYIFENDPTHLPLFLCR